MGRKHSRPTLKDVAIPTAFVILASLLFVGSLSVAGSQGWRINIPGIGPLFGQSNPVFTYPNGTVIGGDTGNPLITMPSGTLGLKLIVVQENNDGSQETIYSRDILDLLSPSGKAFKRLSFTTVLTYKSLEPLPNDAYVRLNYTIQQVIEGHGVGKQLNRVVEMGFLGDQRSMVTATPAFEIRPEEVFPATASDLVVACAPRDEVCQTLGPPQAGQQRSIQWFIDVSGFIRVPSRNQQFALTAKSGDVRIPIKFSTVLGPSTGGGTTGGGTIPGTVTVTPSTQTITIKTSIIGDLPCEVKGTCPPPLGDVDTDGDGIFDKIELQMGTNPNSKDSDGDGVPDNLDAYPLDPTQSITKVESVSIVTGTISASTPTTTSKPVTVLDAKEITEKIVKETTSTFESTGTHTTSSGAFETPFGLMRLELGSASIVMSNGYIVLFVIAVVLGAVVLVLPLILRKMR